MRKFLLLMILVLLLPEARAFGQYNPYLPVRRLGPRQKRAAREFAVARVGAESRALVETFGEDAVAALFVCSPPVGKRLAKFHNSGELAKLPRPGDLLKVIGQPGNGDDVALFAMEHVPQLSDVSTFDAYLAAPLDHALGLVDLETSAARMRAGRLSANTAQPGGLWAGVMDGPVIVVVVVVGIILLLLWRKREHS